MSSPKVSVIIPNYNYAKYIAKAIESVMSQTYKNLEIIVIDDGSKDDSLEVLANFGDKIRVVSQKNEGVSRARNHGAEISDGEYLAFLDADDAWLPEKLEKQFEKFAEDGQIGLVHCSMTLINSEDQPIGEMCDGQEGWVAEELLRFERTVVSGSGSSSLIKREIFMEVGGFDYRLSTSADWDLCYRVADRYKFGFVKETLVLYRIHNSNMHSNIEVMERDMLLGFEKAFASGSKNSQKIRKECYGNLHLILAGSYYQAKQYGKFLEHAQKSLKYNPSKAAYFLSYPFRLIKKFAK